MGKPVRPYGCYLVGMGLPIDKNGNGGISDYSRHDRKQDAFCRHPLLSSPVSSSLPSQEVHTVHRIKKKAVQENCSFLLLYALLNTTLHYAFFYFGLSHNAGARSAELNSMSVFTVVILACIFFKSDKDDVAKGIGLHHRIPRHPSLEPWRKESGSFTLPGRRV